MDVGIFVGSRALIIGQRFCFCAYSVSCAQIDSREDPTLAVVLVHSLSELYNVVLAISRSFSVPIIFGDHRQAGQLLYYGKI